ncbi:hypothetical protein y1807 [Yersinia pestis KIM10+]|uniref:HTH hxlR-type domain-containing protein n=5 Tax=Yersinia pseudotuberculosis complex TaxID=1649845 RepID=Q8D0P8_YERPE|nr:hypothetical protein y1807 [Yersinia pestis KIM10+]KFB61427.1 transcriptional regulator [Yersinia pestis subsp. pestis]
MAGGTGDCDHNDAPYLEEEQLTLREDYFGYICPKSSLKPSYAIYSLYVSTYQKVSVRVTKLQNMNGNISFPEQLRRGELLNVDCPSREILKRVTSRWGVLVLIALSNETLRFSALRRKIGGVSEKMLAQTLQHLEEDGFIDRTAYPVVPPHVEYSLTPLGKEIQEQVEGLTVWLETNLHRIMEQRQQRSV